MMKSLRDTLLEKNVIRQKRVTSFEKAVTRRGCAELPSGAELDVSACG